MIKSVVIFLFFIFYFLHCPFAQVADSTEKKITQYALSGNVVYGFVYAHDIAVENTRGTIVTGIELKCYRNRLDKYALKYTGKTFSSGFTLAYYHFTKRFLGNAVYGSYFIEPYFINNQKLKLGLIAKIGVSYNSNPFNDETNQQNKSYSLYLNPYLSIGLNSSFKAGKKLHVNIDAMFNHNSNGGIYHPNYGINFPTASLGIIYDLDKNKIKDLTPQENFKWNFEVMPFLSYKTISLDREHFNWIYGLALQAERKVWFFNSFNVGVEWVCDYSLKRSLQISGIPVRDHNRVGFLAGHAFLFDKFNFSQQIGFFAYNPVPGMFSIYHRWGLYYRLGKNCMAGFNLLAHKQIADFLDVRFIYTFRKLGTQ